MDCCVAQARGLQLVAERERSRAAATEAELHRVQALQSTYQGLQDPQVCPDISDRDVTQGSQESDPFPYTLVNGAHAHCLADPLAIA